MTGYDTIHLVSKCSRIVQHMLDTQHVFFVSFHYDSKLYQTHLRSNCSLCVAIFFARTTAVNLHLNDENTDSTILRPSCSSGSVAAVRMDQGQFNNGANIERHTWSVLVRTGCLNTESCWRTLISISEPVHTLRMPDGKSHRQHLRASNIVRRDIPQDNLIKNRVHKT